MKLLGSFFFGLAIGAALVAAGLQLRPAWSYDDGFRHGLEKGARERQYLMEQWHLSSHLAHQAEWEAAKLREKIANP